MGLCAATLANINKWVLINKDRTLADGSLLNRNVSNSANEQKPNLTKPG